MNARQLKRLAALARGPVLLLGAAACVEQQNPGSSNVVTAPTANAAQADPATPTSATAAAPATTDTTASTNPADTPEAGGRPWRRPINAPRWQDGGSAGGPRPPIMNAMPTNKPGNNPPNP